MPAMRDHIQAYVQRPEKQRLQREAAARGISVSQCVIDCLREYFAWREEMAAAIDNPGRSGEAHTGGPIQVLLARTESRLADAGRPVPGPRGRDASAAEHGRPP